MGEGEGREDEERDLIVKAELLLEGGTNIF